MFCLTVIRVSDSIRRRRIHQRQKASRSYEKCIIPRSNQKTNRLQYRHSCSHGIGLSVIQPSDFNAMYTVHEDAESRRYHDLLLISSVFSQSEVNLAHADRSCRAESLEGTSYPRYFQRRETPSKISRYFKLVSESCVPSPLELEAHPSSLYLCSNHEPPPSQSSRSHSTLCRKPPFS